MIKIISKVCQLRYTMNAMSSASIVISKLSKQYPSTDVFALQNLSLNVQSGEVYGFLGANGAGKSTTIRLLLNFIQPTSGTAHILGKDIANDYVDVKKYVGYLSGEIALYPKATARQLFNFLQALQPAKHDEYLSSLIKRFDLDIDKPIASLSKGNRQKVGLLQAFMHEPEVLILDEPTSGLDPLMQEEFFKLVAESKARGAAVFLSSHNLAEAQRICDRVGIIKNGTLIREQTIDELGHVAQPVLHVTFKNQAEATKAHVNKALVVTEQLSPTVLAIDSAHHLPKTLAILSKYDVTGLRTDQPDLEGEFMEFYEDKS